MPNRRRCTRKTECPHCRGGAEVFRYLRRQYVFDIDRARELVRDGRSPVEVDEQSVTWCVETTRIYQQHVHHVDIKFPGIIAHVYFPLPDGGEAHGHVLIDGNHRAARCLKLGKPFYAYLLSPAESRQVLLARPRRPRGWKLNLRVSTRSQKPAGRSRKAAQTKPRVAAQVVEKQHGRRRSRRPSRSA